MAIDYLVAGTGRATPVAFCVLGEVSDQLQTAWL